MIKQIGRTIALVWTLTIDALLLWAGFGLAWWLRFELELGAAIGPNAYVPLADHTGLRAGLLLITLLVFTVSGVYARQHGRHLLMVLVQLAQALLVAFALLVIAIFLLDIPFTSRLMLIYAVGLSMLMLGGSRLIGRVVQRRLWRRGIGVVRVLVVGDGAAANALMRDLIRQDAAGIRLSGQLLAAANALTSPSVVPVLGTIADLQRIVRRHRIDQIMLATSDDQVIQTVTTCCIEYGIPCCLMPGIAQRHAQLRMDTRYGRAMVRLDPSDDLQAQRVAKRLLDLVLSLLVLLPLGLLATLVIAILIKLDSPGPVFFRQRRLTRTGHQFWVYKFRTMVTNADELKAQLLAQNEASGPIFKMRDDPRLTRVGKWLRRTSLDELPQIFNIVRGDMSWVGPRPPLPSEVEQYEEWQKRRLGTTTGLTGLWQVSGRSLLPFEEMVKLDLYYIENWSIWLDLKILFKTIPAVLTGRGAF